MPIEKQKLVIILRGLPGAGKSYIAKEYLKSLSEDAVVLSSDDFFIKDKVFHFDKDKLQEAHEWNFKRFKEELTKGTNTIIVDNTNIKKYHYYHYLDTAQRNNYLVLIGIIPHNDVSNKELEERNVHNIGINTIRHMRNNFEWSI